MLTLIESDWLLSVYAMNRVIVQSNTLYDMPLEEYIRVFRHDSRCEQILGLRKLKSAGSAGVERFYLHSREGTVANVSASAMLASVEASLASNTSTDTAEYVRTNTAEKYLPRVEITRALRNHQIESRSWFLSWNLEMVCHMMLQRTAFVPTGETPLFPPQRLPLYCSHPGSTPDLFPLGIHFPSWSCGPIRSADVTYLVVGDVYPYTAGAPTEWEVDKDINEIWKDSNYGCWNFGSKQIFKGKSVPHPFLFFIPQERLASLFGTRFKGDSPLVTRFEGLYEDVEGFVKWLAHVRGEMLNQDAGTPVLRPDQTVAEEIIEPYRLHSPWVVRVAHQLSLVGTDREMVAVPTGTALNNLLSLVVRFMADWTDIGLYTNVGSVYNIARHSRFYDLFKSVEVFLGLLWSSSTPSGTATFGVVRSWDDVKVDTDAAFELR